MRNEERNMEFNEYFGGPVIDCHIHYPHPVMMDSLIATCDRLQIGRFNVVCTPHPERLSLVPDALHLKSNHPDRVFVFGGLDVSAYFMAPDRVGDLFASYIDLLLEAGCDGIKMIEGKPDMRKRLPIPAFDSHSFTPYWEKIAQHQVPVIFHVNDPEEFWDPDRIPGWALDRGWFYGDGSYINNEEQYTEVFNVLAENPSLKIIFAHFLFFSSQQARLGALLDQYPNIYVDLTPGIEMFHHFSAQVEETRDFFLKYQDRILFGTDIGAKTLLGDPDLGIDFADSQARVTLVRNFLENEGEFHLRSGAEFLFGDPTVTFHGIGLPEAVVDKIYHQNFEKVVGVTPHPLNLGKSVQLCDQVEGMIALQGAAQPGVPGDTSVVKTVKSHFEAML
jgi:predicted TIM-barrel fold metal-dependent hydrolase